MKNASFMASFDRESSSDICHYGVHGMKWGQNLFGKEKISGLRRAQKRQEGLSSREQWDIKDDVDRMRLESDYRRLTEEQELYAQTQADKIRNSRTERVKEIAGLVSMGLGIAVGVTGLIKNISGKSISQIVDDHKIKKQQMKMKFD